MAGRVLALVVANLLLNSRGSPLTNPLVSDSQIGQVIPTYLQSGPGTKKAYYNETPALHLEAGEVQHGRRDEFSGKHETCLDIDFDVKWSATLSSSVYSTPLVFLSTEGRKHVLVSTFYQTLELLKATGDKPWGWPTTFEGSTFQGTPVLYDVDGDGIDDIGVVDKNANVFFVRMGEFGQYLEDYHMQVPSLRVKKDWFVGLDAAFMDYTSLTSMFDRKQSGYRTGSERAAEAAAGGSGGDAASSSASAAAAAAAGGSAAAAAGGSGGGGAPRVVRPDDLSLSKPPPRGVQSRLSPRRAADGGRRLLAEEAEGGAEGGAEEEGDAPSSESAYGSEGQPPFRSDDFSGSRADFYYGGGTSGRPPIRSFDDGYDFDAMGMGGGFLNESQYVNIDPHVLGSPVVVDVNNDGRLELIMAVSYYFDRADHAAMHARGVDFDPDNYIAGGVACWDLASQEWSWTVHLDLTTDKTRFKALIYGSPTVVDLDGDGRSEVIIGTSLGLLYVLDGETGFARRHFPIQFHEIQAQVAAADVHGGLHLEIIVADMGGNLVLVDLDGEVIWDAKLSGSLPYTPTVGDVDGDGQLDVLAIAVQDKESHLWVVDGSTGVALLGYPIKPPGAGMFSASALLVDLSALSALSASAAAAGAGRAKTPGASTSSSSSSSGLSIIVPSFDGYIYLVDGARKCFDRVDVGDHIYSTPLLDDVTGDGLLDLVVGTVSGQVVTVGTSLPVRPRNVWDGFPRARGNGFVAGQTGIEVLRDVGLQPRKDASADYQNYTIEILIWDHRKLPTAAGVGEGVLGLEMRYDVTIAPNSNQVAPLFKATYSKPGTYTVQIPIQPPEHLALVVAMVTEHGLKYEDSIVVQVTTSFHSSIKYLPLSIVAGLATMLLLLAV